MDKIEDVKTILFEGCGDCYGWSECYIRKTYCDTLNNRAVKIRQLFLDESKKTANQILDRFNEWADARIADFESIPRLPNKDHVRLKARIDTLQSTKANLARIVQEGIKDV